MDDLTGPISGLTQIIQKLIHPGTDQATPAARTIQSGRIRPPAWS
ncbi:MAG: hypothetical protein OP8BY_1728 [Candidatus Saccharicenans subterraneus]|uniref:Uncharacterized protein n=1 Tax=Candidatus Saccharicenans subterraneus TaxID=2508984 RepID=A0A3E2BP65_9BACT|nr:MAG: hypothetical protein OP8BY_1728 [Candidatus Saccharicenans subterraneum]